MTFVGRTPELATFERAISDADRGHGGLLLVAGEPGIGKTTLCEQATASASAAGALVLWGRCPEGTGAPPFWPWNQALRAWASRLEPDDVRTAAGNEAVALALIAPALGPVLGVDATTSIDPFQLRDDVAVFLRRRAGDSPLVVIIDDLQWGDQSTVDLLSHVVADGSTSRLLLVATMRATIDPDAPIQAALGGLSRRAVTITLTGLASDEVAELARAGHSASPMPSSARSTTPGCASVGGPSCIDVPSLRYKRAP